MNVLPQMTRIEYTFCFCCIFVFFYHHCLSSLALLFYHLFIRFYAFIHFVQFESILLHSLGIVFNGVVVFFRFFFFLLVCCHREHSVAFNIIIINDTSYMDASPFVVAVVCFS